MLTNQSEMIETASPPKEEAATVSKYSSNNILFVTNTSEFGGTEVHLLELIRRLRGPGVQISVVCLGTDFFSERLDPEMGVRVIKCTKTPQSLWAWSKFIRTYQPDVVFFVYGWIRALSWKASVGAYFAGVRRLYALFQLIPPPLPPSEELRTPRDLWRRVFGKKVRERLGIRLAGHIYGKTICVSDAVRNSLIKDYRFPAETSVTVYNGVSLAKFIPSDEDGMAVRARLGIPSGEFVLVCAARLSKEKGIDVLLQAVSELLGRNLSCRCIIVGDGYLKAELAEQVKALGLGGHVFLEGFQKDVKPYLLASDVFVLTSYREGLPLSVLEAMACGLPCVVTSVGGNAEAVAHNENGLVVRPGSVDEVVEAISYVMAHPEARAQMSLKARSKAKAFDMEARMTDIKQIILN